ncbi:MAG TPA: aconitase X catalytic domain-containing protein, partial [Bacillota bacterium]|nr:aconitase X catalytic domain-containing protein [Bacillota bacterium]
VKNLKLTQDEQEILSGKRGEAAKIALEIIIELGELYGAAELIPVSKAHIDGCLYGAVGEAGLEFAEKMHQMGGRVAVPTTLNANSRDINCWVNHRMNAEFAEKNARMEKAYLGMGAIPTWTCAPYQGVCAPRFGEQVAWAESNAIVYVNSVIGARTERYGDYTDLCCALTGRAPKFGLHIKKNRLAQIIINCEGLPLKSSTDDFAVLGYLVGKLAKDKIPAITGIPQWVTSDQLKAFSAAIASSGAVAMFHMIGITPEAPDLNTISDDPSNIETIEITKEMYLDSRKSLSSATPESADAILIGCPHASAAELMEIADLLNGRFIPEEMEFWIYTNREVYSLLESTLIIDNLIKSGVRIIRDTCFLNTDLSGWNMKTVMTNSAKYAHYMKALTGREVVFANLGECINTALQSKGQPRI